MRTKFICIIWTYKTNCNDCDCSWGLSLFVLFEPEPKYLEDYQGSWGLSLFVLFEQEGVEAQSMTVLED